MEVAYSQIRRYVQRNENNRPRLIKKWFSFKFLEDDLSGSWGGDNRLIYNFSNYICLKTNATAPTGIWNQQADPTLCDVNHYVTHTSSPHKDMINIITITALNILCNVSFISIRFKIGRVANTKLQEILKCFVANNAI